MKCWEKIGIVLLCLTGGLCAEEVEPDSIKAVREQRRYYFPNGSLQKIQSFEKNVQGQYFLHGPELEFYEKGQPKSQGILLQGKRSGEWKFITETGELSIGNFYNGLRSGTWKTWSSSGRLLIQEQYFNDRLNGTQKYFYPEGQISREVFYNKGVKEGLETVWHINGRRARVTHWVLGNKNGEFHSWSDEGISLVSGTYLSNLPIGIWEWRNFSNKVMQTTDFSQSGTGTFYDYTTIKGTSHDGKELVQLYLLKSTELVRGIIEGKQKRFFPDGELEASVTFKSGLRDGLSQQFFESGALKGKGQFVDDHPIGIFVEYQLTDNGDYFLSRQVRYSDDGDSSEVEEMDQQGNTFLKMSFLQGNPHGEMREYNSSGNIVREGEYYKGHRQGKWTDYFLDGRVKATQEFLLGKEDGSVEEWYNEQADKTMQKKLLGAFSYGEKNGQWIWWYPNGGVQKELYYQHGLAHGKSTEYWERDDDSEEDQERPKLKGSYKMGQRDGEWSSWYMNGHLKSKGLYKDGVAHGKFQEWYDFLINGMSVLKLHGEYKDGKKVGRWESYYRNGKLKIAEMYNSDQLTGLVSEYYETGVLKRSMHFSNGKLNGVQLVYHANKKLKLKTEYQDGLLSGSYKEYFIDGTLSVQGQYQRSLPTGDWKWYKKEDGSTIQSSTLEDGSGTFYRYYSSGVLRAEDPLLNGVLNGAVKRWYRSGQLRSQQYFEKGLKQGLYEEYHEDGNILEKSLWKDGIREGLYTVWYGNEQKKAEYHFKQNLPHGPAHEWHENGQIKSQGAWVEGVRNGKWLWFDRYGDELSVKVYDLGLVLYVSSPEKK